MNNPLDLDTIKGRAESATAGPWTTSGPDTIAQWVIYDSEWAVAHAAAYDHNNVLSDRPGARGPAYIDSDANAEFIAHARTDVPALVAEVERLRARDAELLALVQPILDRTKDQIGTHSERCFEYHVACLAGVVRTRLDAGSQTEGAGVGT